MEHHNNGHHTTENGLIPNGHHTPNGHGPPNGLIPNGHTVNGHNGSPNGHNNHNGNRRSSDHRMRNNGMVGEDDQRIIRVSDDDDQQQQLHQSSSSQLHQRHNGSSSKIKSSSRRKKSSSTDQRSGSSSGDNGSSGSNNHPHHPSSHNGMNGGRGNNHNSPGDDNTTPICRCRVMYLGSSVPHITKDGLQGIQEPLRELYPDDGILLSNRMTSLSVGNLNTLHLQPQLHHSSTRRMRQSGGESSSFPLFGPLPPVPPLPPNGHHSLHHSSSHLNGSNSHIPNGHNHSSIELSTSSQQLKMNGHHHNHNGHHGSSSPPPSSPSGANGGGPSTFGIDSWLSVWSNGILIENVDDSGRDVKRFFPIESLHYCAAVRYVVVPNAMTSGNGTTDSNGGLQSATSTLGHNNSSTLNSNRGVAKFLPLDSPFSRHADISLHPPIFACILRRTTGIRVLECHAFICKREQAANALVRCCFHAFADFMHVKEMENNQKELKDQSDLIDSESTNGAPVVVMRHHPHDRHADAASHRSESIRRHSVDRMGHIPSLHHPHPMHHMPPPHHMLPHHLLPAHMSSRGPYPFRVTSHPFISLPPTPRMIPIDPHHPNVIHGPPPFLPSPHLMEPFPLPPLRLITNGGKHGTERGRDKDKHHHHSHHSSSKSTLFKSFGKKSSSKTSSH